MITKHCIETAFCFFHQKQRIFQYSTLDWQKEDIEYAIGEYIDNMSAELYTKIANGKKDFLRDHTRFFDDLTNAVNELEKLLQQC